MSINPNKDSLMSIKIDTLTDKIKWEPYQNNNTLIKKKYRIDNYPHMIATDSYVGESDNIIFYFQTFNVTDFSTGIKVENVKLLLFNNSNSAPLIYDKGCESELYSLRKAIEFQLSDK